MPDGLASAVRARILASGLVDVDNRDVAAERNQIAQDVATPPPATDECNRR